MTLDDLERRRRAASAPPPASRAEAHARLVAIDDAIAAIRTQIAAADIKRQVHRQPLDSDWFHRAKTALRHLQRERALLQQQARALPGGKPSLEARIVQVVRPDYDDAAWSRVLAAARASGRESG